MSTLAKAELPSDESDSDYQPEEENRTNEAGLPTAPGEKAAEELNALKANTEKEELVVKEQKSQEMLQKLAAEAAARVMQSMKKTEEEGKKQVQLKFAGETFSSTGVKRGRGETLEAVVREITKKKPLNSMSKSQLDWECFKDREQLEDTLAVNRKDGFVNKAKFLVESSAKEKERLKKKRRGPLD